MNPPFEFLEGWYRAQCNGYWEHANGITIETLDNPGWMVSIDLAETTLEDHPMQPVRQERSDKDWMVCTVERNQFRGQGDPGKLHQILEVFRGWAASRALDSTRRSSAAMKSTNVPNP